MVPRTATLLLSSLLAVLGIIAAATGHSEDAWLAPLGVVLVLILPGYALSVALLPELTGIVRLLITLGLSLVVAVIGGLVLNLSPWGLRPLPWALWLGGITVAGAAVAMARGAGAAPWPEFRRPKFTAAAVVEFVAAALILGLTINVATSGARESGTYYTQLWAVPAHNGQQNTLNVGVRNGEPDSMSYRIIVEDSGQKVTAWDIMDLKPGEQRTEQIDLVVQPSSKQFVVQLIRLSEPTEVYRSVEISPDTFTATVAP